MVCLDLDDFKITNDEYGHKVGDGVLVEASKRMLASVRATDTVARTGGDEFIILVNDIQNDSDISRILQHLKTNLIGGACINGKKLEINASIGFAAYPVDRNTLDKLQSKADERMYEAKRSK